MFLILLSGFAGGALRGLIGLIKHRLSYKEVPFRWKYFFGMIAVSGLIGFAVVAAVQDVGFNIAGVFSWSLALIIGYAGGDFLENMYKMIINKGQITSSKDSINSSSLDE